MKVLITGISGFVGSYLAEALLQDGHEVFGFLRQSNRLNYPSVKRLAGRAVFLYGSLLDPQAVRGAVREAKPDAILHLGAVTPVAYSFEHPVEVTETNYLGTIHLAEAAMKECELKRFIFASSMETYGFQTKRTPFVETDELHPACPYAVAKVASENYLQYLFYAHKFPAVSIRQTNCYGRRENDYFIVESTIVQMLKGGDVNLGDPRPVRNFLFIDDLVSLYKHLLVADSSVDGEVFNTGPDNGVTIAELAELCQEATGWRSKINWNTRPRRPGEIFFLNSSNSKAIAELGWEPRITLKDGLQRTVCIWRENLNL